MSAQVPTIAFFGATGGVTNGVLVNALRSGHHVIALVRTPSKLTTQLQAQGISEKVLEAQLTIKCGNALDVAAVKSALTADNPDYLVSSIVTGLGGAPRFQFNMCKPLQLATIDNPHICATAAKTMVLALEDIYKANRSLARSKPRLTFVSTTGISRGPEDVPYGMRTMYHDILSIPHEDKREMEGIYRSNMSSNNDAEPVFSGIIGIRPTLLTGGTNADEGIGLSKIKVGTERSPAVGWTVSRADVGEWMWLNAVSDMDKRNQWENEMITLCN